MCSKNQSLNFSIARKVLLEYYSVQIKSACAKE